MLLTACDEAYLGQARALIRSCARHQPNRPFLLFLINGDSVSDSTIQSWHPRIVLDRATWANRSDWRGAMCCARAEPIRKVLERYRRTAVYLDSDTVVRGPLDGLFAILERADLTVAHRPQLELVGPAGTPHFAKFNSGVIGVRPSRNGLRFARLFHQAIQDHRDEGRPLTGFDRDRGMATTLDQELLYVCYLKLKHEMTFVPLPARFNDSRFHATSVVWHGKGTARGHLSFRIESARHRIPFAYHPLGLVNSGLGLIRALARPGGVEIREEDHGPVL